MHTPVTPIDVRTSVHKLGSRESQKLTVSRQVAEHPPTSRHISLMVPMIVVSLIAVVILTLTRPATMPPSISGSAAPWNLELASTGTTAVRALVYGPEAGFHVITVPSRTASGEERRGVLARIGRGDVYLMSLGWSNIQVTTSRPPGDNTPLLSLAATGRMLRIFTNARGMGVRTSWR